MGEIPTHYIPPGQPGFEQAGGAKGPGYDFMSHPSGDPALAASYMKKAGYPSGKYTGGETLTMVSDNATQQLNVAEIAAQQFEKLGFKVKHQGRHPRLDVHEVLPGAEEPSRRSARASAG